MSEVPNWSAVCLSSFRLFRTSLSFSSAGLIELIFADDPLLAFLVHDFVLIGVHDCIDQLGDLFRIVAGEAHLHNLRIAGESHLQFTGQPADRIGLVAFDAGKRGNLRFSQRCLEHEPVLHQLRLRFFIAVEEVLTSQRLRVLVLEDDGFLIRRHVEKRTGRILSAIN